MAATGTGSTGEAPAITSAQSRSRPADQSARMPVALNDHAGTRLVRGELQRVVEHRLVLDDARRLDPARRRDDHDRLRVVDTGGQLMGGEPAEHHRVHGAEPGARQHRDDGLRDHRHVQHHPVTLADPQTAQDTGETCCLVEQFPVGVRPLGARHGGVVDQRGLIAATVGDVAVQGVGAGVQLPVGEPAVERWSAVVEDALGCTRPRHRLGRLRPECGGIATLASNNSR